MRSVLVDARCLLEWAENDGERSALPLRPVPGGLAGLDLVRRYAQVIAVVEPQVYPRRLFEQRCSLVQDFGFSLGDILAPPIRSAADGDIFLSPSPLVLRAWKARRRFDHALLWHLPDNHLLGDELTWTRVCDWQVVAWFARGAHAARSLAASS